MESITNNVAVKSKNSADASCKKQDDISYKNPSVWAIGGGALLGYSVPAILPYLANQFNGLDKIDLALNKGVTSSESAQLKQATAKMLEKSGLKANGVRFLTEQECKQELEKLTKKYAQMNPFTRVWKVQRDFIYQTLQGNNACFLVPDKKYDTIFHNRIINPDNYKLASFHEMGHGMTYNLSKLGKILLSSHKIAGYAKIAILLTALLKTKKAEGEKPNGVIDKTATFVKDNAGKLMFATFAPMLIDEALATYKGEKFAKKLLSPELFKKVAKCNRLGFASYLIAATGMAIGTYLGVKVKDAVAHKTVNA